MSRSCKSSAYFSHIGGSEILSHSDLTELNNLCCLIFLFAGIISYTEYLFLLSILTSKYLPPNNYLLKSEFQLTKLILFRFLCFSEPETGFLIAFNMFDTDGNQRVDKEEFLVVSSMTSFLKLGNYFYFPISFFFIYFLAICSNHNFCRPFIRAHTAFTSPLRFSKMKFLPANLTFEHCPRTI